MEECKYCKATFKRVASHINHCPSRPKGNKQKEKENQDTLNMTPCPHCKKMFKRVSAHVYRCPQKPNDNEEISDEKTAKNDSVLKEKVVDEDTLNMTPCRHCKKMFKRVSAHVYRCPERPNYNEKISDEETAKNDSVLKENDVDEDTLNMTPCRHCKKMFKRVSAHVYRCPERPNYNEEISDKETAKNNSVLKENDVDEDTLNMTPCRHCKKMFKRVSAHVFKCPKRPDDNEEISDEKPAKNDSVLKENDVDENIQNMTPCPHCKKMLKPLTSHNCPLQSDIKGKNTADYKEKILLTKSCFDQSEHRNNFSEISILKSQTKSLKAESENFDVDKLTRPPLHGDYLPSPKQKSPSSIDSVITKSTLYSFSVNSNESPKSKPVSYSQTTPRKLKRPPIHDDDFLYQESIDGSVKEDLSLTDLDDDYSFYKSSESEDSFSYLQQDLKRPPIHKEKSPMPSEVDKKIQFLDDEELFEFRHQVLRE